MPTLIGTIWEENNESHPCYSWMVGWKLPFDRPEDVEYVDRGAGCTLIQAVTNMQGTLQSERNKNRVQVRNGREAHAAKRRAKERLT